MKTEVVVSALIDIKRKHGELTAKRVVTESRPEDAPLHPCFQWNDAIAGENWREWQARHLIRSVRIKNPDTQELQHAFVHVPSLAVGKEGYYEETSIVVKNIDLFEQALGELLQKIAGIQATVDEIRRLASNEDSVPVAKLRIAMKRVGRLAEAIQH